MNTKNATRPKMTRFTTTPTINYKSMDLNIFELLTTIHTLYAAWCTSSKHDILDDCVSLCHRILNRTTGLSSSSSFEAFYLLGKVTCSKASINSSLEELDRGIEYIHSAITTHAHFPHNEVPVHVSLALSDIASALHLRWTLVGELDDLQLSIHIRRLILHRCSSQSTQHSLTATAALSTAIFVRFAHFPRVSDLDEVLRLDEQTLSLCPRDNRATLMDRFGCLCTVAQSLLVRWDYDEDGDHIQKAIIYLREAVDLGRGLGCPSDYALALNALSEAIQSQLFLSDAEVEECVALDREALQLVNGNHPERPLTLAAMATTILVRYIILEEPGDWDFYMELHKELESLVTNSRERYAFIYDPPWAFSTSLHHYSGRYALTSIFRQALYIKLAENDWQNAQPISRRRLAPELFLRRLIDPIRFEIYLVDFRVKLRQVPAHRARSRLPVIGSISWTCRGKLCRGHIEPTPSSIKESEEMWLTNLPPDGHPFTFAYYNRLAEDFHVKFCDLLDDEKPIEALEFLQKASQYHLQALELQETLDHPFKYQQMSKLALTYVTHAETAYDHNIVIPRSLVEDAIKHSTMSLDSCPPGFPTDIKNVADAYIIKYKLWKEDSDLETAMRYLRQGCDDHTVPAMARHEFADRWLDVAVELDHKSRRDAYISWVDILHEVIMESFNLVRLTDIIGNLGAPDFLESAREHCIVQGAYDDAMYLLGKGRGMMWARLLKLQFHRVGGIALYRSNDKEKLKMVLEAAEMERQVQAGPAFPVNDREVPVTSNSRYRHDRLAFDIGRLFQQRENSVDELEVWRPFTDSISHKGFPVVVLNNGVKRCDALIVRGRDHAVRHILLPECDRAKLDELVLGLQSSLKAGGAHVRGAGPKKRKTAGPSVEDILASVWHHVVQPIVKALGLGASDNPPRLWWYPTGPFCQLPLHGAGIYTGANTISIQDYVVSSYLPAFNVPGKDSSDLKPETKILAVYLTRALGEVPLLEAEPEVRGIRKVVEGRPDISFVELGESKATLEAVKSALPAATIVHFALHGKQNVKSPLESSLTLSDPHKPFKLSQLLEMHLPNADLVFLSACETATGHKVLPEEVIHIAATMLFVGFKRAVGTMWSISDCDGPPIARETYKCLLGSEGVEPVDAAYALHTSVKMLRARNVPAIRWAPFIHIGL